uniref:Translation initiation factor eIF2B subunit alpha n=2 Tax=Sinocyclocheilus grahami TaxID=75366 RepID=A0A672P3J1_SINGR
MYLFIYVFLSELVEYFRAQIREDPDVASAVAAIRSLLEFLKRDQSEFSLAIHRLEETDSSVAVSSGGELFLRFISLTSLEHPVGSDLSQCKNVMIERGELFLKKISLSRGKVLENAAADNKRFTVYVTESQPDSTGYIMEKDDLVIVGAECVVESGGIGTYQMAVCSKAHNKPFYVVAESFKFVRLYPLNQQDVPDRFKYKADILKTVKDLNQEHPMIDYTPPSLITLLFTDLGVLTPSAVSDELINLYL